VTSYHLLSADQPRRRSSPREIERMSAIQELQSAITAVAEKAGQSVVGIGSRQRGSGVVIADGKVLTNAHNIRGDEVTVTFSDGGALLDGEGRLVGLNTNRIGEGFYLALPADPALRERIDALGRGESPSRRRLGVAVAPSFVARRLRRSVGLPERDGLLVRGVEDGSAADKAGIVQGDLIVEVAGKAIEDADDLVEALASASAGSAVAFTPDG